MNPGEFAIINREWRYIRYGKDGEELYDLKNDPNEWDNLSLHPEMAGKMEELDALAPTEFAEPVTKLSAKRDLLFEGETFRWMKPEPKPARN